MNKTQNLLITCFFSILYLYIFTKQVQLQDPFYMKYSVENVFENIPYVHYIYIERSRPLQWLSFAYNFLLTYQFCTAFSLRYIISTSAYFELEKNFKIFFYIPSTQIFFPPNSNFFSNPGLKKLRAIMFFMKITLGGSWQPYI